MFDMGVTATPSAMVSHHFSFLFLASHSALYVGFTYQSKPPLHIGDTTVMPAVWHGHSMMGSKHNSSPMMDSSVQQHDGGDKMGTSSDSDTSSSVGGSGHVMVARWRHQW